MAFDATGVEGSSLSPEEAAAAATSFKEMAEDKLVTSGFVVPMGSTTTDVATLGSANTNPNPNLRTNG